MGGPIFLYIFEGRKTETAMVYKKPSTNTTLTHSHTHTHTLNYANSLAVGLRENSQIPGVAKGNLGLISLPHST